MSEIAVQIASRYIRRKQSDAVGKNLLKTLTEPITNSDDSYRRIAESEKDFASAVFPITIFVDKPGRLIRIIDEAEGMTEKELETKFKEYGAAKSGAYEGFSSRGIFGQGLSDVLFYHREGKIKTIKNEEATVCSFYWKKEKQYIQVEKQTKDINRIAREWSLPCKHGTVIEFVLDNTTLHDYENLVKKLSVFYMLRLINNSDRRTIKLVYKERSATKKAQIKYEFPKGDLVDSRQFPFNFEGHDPVTVDVQLYKSDVSLKTVGEERENGLLVFDNKEAVYDQTFFGLDDLPGADKFFGTMKLTGAREIILEKINHPKHPEEILSDTRDGFNKQHEFYKQLQLIVKDWLYPILNEERRRKTNDGISESTIEKHQKAFEELNKLYKQLTGDETSGTIKAKKKLRPIGGIQFARNHVSITVGKRYGLQLLIDTNVVKIGTKVKLKAAKGVVGFSPGEFVVEEARPDENGVAVKTIILTGPKARTADTLHANAGKHSASVVVGVISEEVAYPEDGMVFSPEYVRTISHKDSVATLYIDLTKIKIGTKIRFVSTNDTIQLKRTTISVPRRMRTATGTKLAKIQVEFQGNKNDETGIIEASFGKYLTQCRVDIKEKKRIPPGGSIGKFKDWDFDDGVPPHLQTTYDPMEGSPTQGYILINTSHPINRHYFGESPTKKEALKSHKAQLYLAELILNESLGGMINEAYQKGVIPTNYGAGIDIPVYVAQKKYELGELIYDFFVEPEPTGLESRRTEKLQEAKQKHDMSEEELLENMDDRPRTMVEMYFGLGEQRKHTLEEIASRFGVTRERIRQIINKALAPSFGEKSDPYVTSEDEGVDTRDYLAEEEKRLMLEAEKIVEVSARMYGVKASDLYSKTREANIVVPRHIAMYLLRTKMGLSFPSIGKQFDRDHTTIMHACNKISLMIQKNQKINRRVDKILSLAEVK
ncbi:hypothetical protein K2Y00_02925 [Patescibacteria group bacterium]|nr:hypothetical protein [Patescibacteria group bacterium]